MTFVDLEKRMPAHKNDSLNLMTKRHRGNYFVPADRTINFFGKQITRLTDDYYRILDSLSTIGRAEPENLAGAVFKERIDAGVLDIEEAKHLLRRRMSYVRKRVAPEFVIENDWRRPGNGKNKPGEYIVIFCQTNGEYPNSEDGVRLWGTDVRIDIDFETGDTWIKDVFMKNFQLHHRLIMLCLGRIPGQYVDGPILKDVISTTPFGVNKRNGIGVAVEGMRKMISNLKFAEVNSLYTIETGIFGQLKRYRLNGEVYDIRSEEFCITQDSKP